jgi:uncharacterized membrane protein YphA (DoxX/SURF4 family)
VLTRCRSYGLATAAMLVVLRLTIGWHFFSEGSKHFAEPHWSSEGFLRAAKGPLVPYYHSVVPKVDYGLDAALHSGSEAAQAVERWRSEVTAAWKRQIDDFRKHYPLNEQQRADVDKVGQRRLSQLDSWLDETRDGIAEHLHEWQRLEKSKASPSAGDVPFEKKRIDDARGKLNSQTAGWLAHLRSIEHDLHEELDALLTPEQHTAGHPSGERTKLEQVDRVMKYGILAIGGCLILGLFARLAALLGAAFLASVVLSQPPWLPDANPTYPQLLEMLALLTLVTVPVGRWCGLDFFLHCLFGRRKACDESQS